MADETTGNEETPAEKPKEKETPLMAEDFRDAAKRAGYALVPEADYEGFKKDREELKRVRSIFPEEARGKESDYIKSVTEKAGQVDGMSEQLKGVEALRTENESLKVQNGDLTRGKKLSDMYGHVSRIQQIRNVRVHDRFIDEQKLVDFPLDKHDLSKPEGVKKFTESVWTEVLEPAHKEQVSVVEQVNGPSRRKSEDTDGRGSGDTRQDDSRDETTPAIFGSQA